MEWIVISILVGVAVILSFAREIVKMGLAHEERRHS